MALNFLNDGYFAGKVGIGTVSPLGKLHVKHVGEIYTSLAGSDSAINFLEIQGNPWRIGNRAADDSFRFAQSSDSLGTNVRVTFANGGNVGIGTVSPSELLELKPASGADSKINILKSDGTQKALIGYDNANGGLINLYNEAGTRNVVVRGYGDSYFNAGNVGIGTTTPGAKLEVVSARGAEGIHLNDGSFPTVGKVMLDVDANGDGEITLKNSNSALTSVISGGESSYLMGGNVGIGTASPQSKLQIESTGEALRFTRSGQETYRVIHGTSGLYFTAPNAGNLLFGIHRIAMLIYLTHLEALCLEQMVQLATSVLERLVLVLS